MEPALNESDLVFLFNLRDMIFNGEIVAVLRPDGQVGWMPAPREAQDVRICTICGGSGFLSTDMAALISADFRLENMCPDCHGTGILEDGQPLSNDLPETQPLPTNGGAA